MADSEVQRVQVLFTKTDPETGLDFTDALYYPTGKVPSRKALDAAKQARFDGWKQATKAPAPDAKGD